MNTAHYLEPLKNIRTGCLCCKGAEFHLPMDTVLYNGYGGWTVTKNGQHFFEDDNNKEWEDFRQLQFIEDIAAKEPDADWRAECYTPLHGETYQRQNNKWVLV